MEYWKNGVMEEGSDGVMEEWSGGIMELRGIPHYSEAVSVLDDLLNKMERNMRRNIFLGIK